MAQKYQYFSDDNYNSKGPGPIPLSYDPYRENSRNFFEQNNPDVSTEDLVNFFENDKIRGGESSRNLAHWGGIYSLARSLKIDFQTGLITTGNSVDLQKRIQLYGSNYYQPQDPKTLWAFIEEAFEDTMLRILIVAAFASLIAQMIEDYTTGWMDGVAIFASVIIIVSVSSINNYMKEKQFEKLYASQEKTNVNVFRNGRTETICVFDLVVGDLLFIQQGDIIPVDGVLVQGASIKMDEASVTGESELINKIPAKDIYAKEGTPFIFSDSKVMEGTGLMLVCTVGPNTHMNLIKSRLAEEQAPTPLQVKLEDVANAIGKIGTAAAGITLLALLCHLAVNIAEGELDIISMDVLEDLIDYLLLAVTIIVVAVPEGLPLAVTLSLAYSVNKMKEENNFVRHLEACETMGGANNICSDKTGTLTQNIMTVTNLFIEGQEFYYKSFDQRAISPLTFKIIAEGIAINSEATPIRTDQGNMEHRGNRTECALLELIDNLGIDYRDFRPSNRILRILPFSSDRKRMSTIYHDIQTGKYIVYCKGAPEFLFERCTTIVKEGHKIVQLSPYEKHDLNYIVIMKFAEQSLRTLALAYREFKDDPSSLPDEELEKNLTLIGVIGMQDPLRPEVKEAIRKCTDAGIVVRMVTGDNMVTACSIAKQCGILEQTFDLNEAMSPAKKGTSASYKILEGKVFRELVGGIVYEQSDQEKSESKAGVGKVANFEKFKEIAKELKVLARSSSRDKYILVAGLIQMGNVVAVTGDGTNDVEALKKADIGFAMGITGKKVTKWAADIILLDDNFRSIVTACKWGRNIYDSIRKFIQFQLTVNVVALFLAFLGAVVVTKSPLNAIQMLWVNLIMDSFASLALATEKPTDKLLNRLPHSRNEFIISPNMWRNIICHSFYQTVVLCVLMFYGPEIFGIPSSFNMDSWNQDEGVHFTIIFNAFVFLQVFNEINCRKLNKNEFNVFEGICSNWIFLTIEILTIAVQIAIVQYGGNFVECSTLTLNQHLICVAIGASELLIAVFIKCVPECLFNRIKLFRISKMYDLDSSFPSLLRKRASIRINKSNSRSMIWLKTI